MNFKVIDKNNWERLEYFEYYLKNIPCTYSLSTKIDISNIISKKYKLYPTMIFAISTIVNKYDEFKIFLDDNNICVYDKLHPCYTVFNKETKLFSNLWTEYENDYKKFYKNYENDIIIYSDKSGMNLKPNIPSNNFSISMIPWVSFDGFNLNLQKGYEYFQPIFTMGKYSFDKDVYLLPISVQVHHSVCDGFHTSRLINEIQELIYNL